MEGYKELNAKYSAFLVFVDIDRSMEVYPVSSIEYAQQQAKERNNYIDSMGYEDCGNWLSTTKLPRRRIYKVHPLN